MFSIKSAPLRGGHGATHTDGHMQRLSVEVNLRALDRGSHAFRDDGQIVVGDAAGNDQKFLATVPQNHIGLTDRVLEREGHLPQNFVARGVPIGVVDRLKAIDVAEQSAESELVTVGNG